MVHHKFTVIFSNRSISFGKIRVRQICRIRPLPCQTPLKQIAAGFPLKLSSQTTFSKLSIRCSLIKVCVHHRSIHLQLFQSVKSVDKPFTFSFFPVEWTTPVILLEPNPSVRVPEVWVLVAPGVDKIFEFSIGHQLSGYFKVVQVDLVLTLFIIETKLWAIMANDVKSFFNFFPLRFSSCRFIFSYTVNSRKYRVKGEAELHISEQEFLVLLFVMQSQLKTIRKGWIQFCIRQKSYCGLIDYLAVHEYFRDGRSGKQSPLVSLCSVPHCVVITIEKEAVDGVDDLISWFVGNKDESLKKPSSVGKVPPWRTSIGDWLDHVILWSQMCAQFHCVFPNQFVFRYEISIVIRRGGLGAFLFSYCLPSFLGLYLRLGFHLSFRSYDFVNHTILFEIIINLMPVARRKKQTKFSKTKKQNRPEQKELLYNKLREGLKKYQRAIVFSHKNMTNNPLKEIKEAWASDSKFFIGKNKVMQVSLGSDEEKSASKNSYLLSGYLKGQTGLLLTNRKLEEVTEFCKGIDQPEFAKAGQIAQRTVTLEKGFEALSQFAFSLEPYLRKLGLNTQLINQKIVLNENFTVAEAGKPIGVEQSKLLKLLNIKFGSLEIKPLCCLELKSGNFKKL